MTTLTTGRHSTSTTAWCFTSCTSKSSSIERTHVFLFLAHFITLTLAQVRALAALHPRPSSWPSLWLLSLRLDFLFSTLLRPADCLPLPLLPPQRRAVAGALQEGHGKTCASPPTTGVRALVTSSTFPQVRSPTALTSTSSRTHRSPSSSRSCRRPGVDDLTLSKMLTEAHREHVDYFVQEGVSVSQLSTSLRSVDQGNLMEIDRGNPMSAKAH